VWLEAQAVKEIDGPGVDYAQIVAGHICIRAEFV
jgi:hypothetical protein